MFEKYVTNFKTIMYVCWYIDYLLYDLWWTHIIASSGRSYITSKVRSSAINFLKIVLSESPAEIHIWRLYTDTVNTLVAKRLPCFLFVISLACKFVTTKRYDRMTSMLEQPLRQRATLCGRQLTAAKWNSLSSVCSPSLKFFFSCLSLLPAASFLKRSGAYMSTTAVLSWVKPGVEWI